jgi:hypothetical protein
MTDGAAIPFTPPHYSLNRVRVLDLPGVRMDDGVAGKTAFELIPAKALVRYARERADELSLPDALHCDDVAARWELPRFIDRLLIDRDTPASRAAEEIVARVGRNLGHVLLALHRGDPMNRAARPEWGDAEWARWATVRRAWLAGGLATGRVGAAIARHARNWLDSVGYRDILNLQVSPFAGDTALVGAARYLSPGAGACLCCDFGQTSIKRGLFIVEGRAIIRCLLLPRAAGLEGDLSKATPAQAGELHRAFVVDTVSDALLLARQRLGPAVRIRELMLSLPCYVNGGRLLGPGGYATMSMLATDATDLLAEAITARANIACGVRLIHDGTAAAATFAGHSAAAVIALGSALGVGFPPESADDLLNIEEISETR